MLLVASYVFYGAWDWRFLSLIWLSTILDYFLGLKIHNTSEEKSRKFFVALSVLGNLSILGFFKYFNFFAENLQALFSLAHINIEPHFLNIILPMGISFYTFQTMSYTIDIYRKEMAPTKRFLDFALFVSFFPQLVAGPIERAKHLLPQVLSSRKVTWDKFCEGSYLIFWGLFLKILIADNLGKIVNPIFAAKLAPNGGAALMAAYAFTFQVFCDFAGYSNIARGLGRVMGFDIVVNFNLPFFATNVQEFWNRWHISLSGWIRDYLYIPLFRALGKMKSLWRVYITIVVAMTVIGLWHGAAWTFVLFGVYHGLLLVLYTIFRAKCHSWVEPKTQMGEKIWFLIRIVFMFQLISAGMLIFRSQSVGQVFDMFGMILFHFAIDDQVIHMLQKFLIFVVPLLFIQWGQFKTGDLFFLYRRHWLIKTFAYSLMTYLLVGWGVMGSEEFIYFQF